MWIVSQILLTILVVFLVATSFGYFVHRALHQEWMWQFYKNHHTHHLILYPPEDFDAPTYRSAGKDNTTYFFIAASSPIIVLPILLFAFHIITLPIFITAFISMAVFGIPNNYLHDSFHISGHWLCKYNWYRELVKLHYEHHVDLQKNFGIYSFLWDRICGTFIKGK
jgi:sterol desaturase/sphingolipid hydroxylase (fatty acid hydroxylase superfamily)